MITKTFERTVGALLDQGLVDLKFTVCRTAGVCAEAVKEEFVRAEEALTAGKTREAPKATSQVPANVMQIICGVGQ